MASIVLWIKSFLAKEDGVTAIEYGLIAALIAVAIIGAVLAVGQTLDLTFDDINNALQGIAPAG